MVIVSVFIMSQKILGLHVTPLENITTCLSTVVRCTLRIALETLTHFCVTDVILELTF
jgi:hypothetical protein